jgi:N-ethylmaleimide reductase
MQTTMQGKRNFANVHTKCFDKSTPNPEIFPGGINYPPPNPNKDLIPNDLQVTYYEQRAGAGLILTDSAWVSKRAIGFMNVPGIFSPEQAEGWKKVTDAVHAKQGKIFLQIGHIGSVSHPDYFEGELPLGPSAINPQEKSFTPDGFKDTVTPRAFTLAQISETIGEYQQAAVNAKAAGFDGIEVHAQIFTLIPQFLSEATNQRTDEYGGSIENRSRIVFDILDAIKKVYPANRIGIKFTPAAFNPGILKPDHLTIPTYEYLLSQLSDHELAFVELAGPSVSLIGTPIESLQDKFFHHFRKFYKGTLMANGGFTRDSANDILSGGLADLVSFGAPFIANPDLPERFRRDAPLTVADPQTYYGGGAKGYTDYPAFNAE